MTFNRAAPPRYASTTFASSWILAAIFVAAAALAQQVADTAALPNWEQRLQILVRDHQLAPALTVVESRLVAAPSDLEARAWHGRLLAWQGHWPEAEAEYRTVLKQVPTDSDILCALADVLLWQGRLQPALDALNDAALASPSDPEILLRRARVLRAMGRNAEARTEFLAVLSVDAHNASAKSGLATLGNEHKHELRIGEDIDTFSYTDLAQVQSLTLSSRWDQRWSTTIGGSFHQRFGRRATRFSAGMGFRFPRSSWLSVTGSAADDHGIVPKRDAGFELGHAIRFRNSFLHGMDAAYQQHWMWYAQAHILTVGLTQTYYLPRDWEWGLTITGARSGFSNAGVEWAPSGSTRLSFPLAQHLRGNLFLGVGAENFAEVDQIGRFSARTFGGGLRFRITTAHEVGGYMARQDRSQQRSQNSYGVSYAIRF